MGEGVPEDDRKGIELIKNPVLHFSTLLLGKSMDDRERRADSSCCCISGVLFKTKPNKYAASLQVESDDHAQGGSGCM